MDHIQFEGIKTSLRQTKDGYSLTLSVHPEDLPDELMRDFVGSRYMVVMVRIGDDERPVNREMEFPGDHAVKMAGMMCREPEFWAWLEEKFGVIVDSEKDCATWLSDFLNIQSRRELKENEDIRNAFNKLRQEYTSWKRN